MGGQVGRFGLRRDGRLLTRLGFTPHRLLLKGLIDQLDNVEKVVLDLFKLLARLLHSLAFLLELALEVSSNLISFPIFGKFFAFSL